MNHYIPVVRKLKGYVVLGFLLVLVFPANAQNMIFGGGMEFNAAILGISPTFYKGMHYDKGEYDFNAIPLYLETNPDGVVGFRMNPYLNLSVRNETSTAVKNFGVGLALPIYPYRSDINQKHTHHFYLAPVFDLLINPNMDDIDLEINLFLEPGYSFRFSQVLGVNLGFSLGKTLSIAPEHVKLSNFFAIRLSCYWVFY